MSSESILTILAIVVGPITAVLVSLYIGYRIADRKQRRDMQFNILTTIVMMQYKGVSEEHTKALNLIELFFHNSPKVRAKWVEYFDALGRRDLPVDEAQQLWRTKQLELIHEMACHLGFQETMKQLDFDRVYTPEGLTSNLIDTPEKIDQIISSLLQHKKNLTSERPETSASDLNKRNNSNP